MKPFTLVILLFLCACASTKTSNISKGEQLKIETYQYDEALTFASVSQQFDIPKTRSIITADLLVKGLDFAFDGLKTVIKKGAEQYYQEYYLSLYNNSFYAQNSTVGMLDPENIKFKGFEINRLVSLDNGKEVAVKACFSLDESKLIDIYTQSKFYMKCDSIRIDYAKVKINDKRWYMPWTWFIKAEDKINMDLDIDIRTNWIDNQGVIHKQEQFGKFYFPIRNFKIGSIDTTYKGEALSGYCYLIPRSASYCLNARSQWVNCYGQGDFDILVKVAESSKNNKLNKMLYDNIDLLDDLDSKPVKDLIK